MRQLLCCRCTFPPSHGGIGFPLWSFLSKGRGCFFLCFIGIYIFSLVNSMLFFFFYIFILNCKSALYVFFSLCITSVFFLNFLKYNLVISRAHHVAQAGLELFMQSRLSLFSRCSLQCCPCHDTHLTGLLMNMILILMVADLLLLALPKKIIDSEKSLPILESKCFPPFLLEAFYLCSLHQRRDLLLSISFCGNGS